LAGIDYKNKTDTVLGPGFAVTCNEKHEVYLTKAPDIIFEIISPLTVKKDGNNKFGIYEAEKVSHCVLAYHDDLKNKGV